MDNNFVDDKVNRNAFEPHILFCLISKYLLLRRGSREGVVVCEATEECRDFRDYPPELRWTPAGRTLLQRKKEHFRNPEMERQLFCLDRIWRICGVLAGKMISQNRTLRNRKVNKK